MLYNVILEYDIRQLLVHSESIIIPVFENSILLPPPQSLINEKNK